MADEPESGPLYKVEMREREGGSCHTSLYLVSVPFLRMNEWNMNTYLYAPKDDDKHRACWRDLYSLEEADQLSHLIHEATSRGIIFIYAIAPGRERDIPAQ